MIPFELPNTIHFQLVSYFPHSPAISGLIPAHKAVSHHHRYMQTKFFPSEKTKVFLHFFIPHHLAPHSDISNYLCNGT